MTKKKLFDPEKELTELPIFWWVLILGLLGTVVTILIISLASNLEWCGTYECFNFAVSAFRVPLGCLTVTLSLIGLIAMAHRSAQTKIQIKLSNAQYFSSQQQNIFANYYKHLEEFEKYTEHYKTLFPSIKMRYIHHKLYPKAKEGDLTPTSLDSIYFRDDMLIILLTFRNLIKDDVSLSTECKQLDENSSGILKNIILRIQDLEQKILKLSGTEKLVDNSCWGTPNLLYQWFDENIAVINNAVSRYFLLINFENNISNNMHEKLMDELNFIKDEINSTKKLKKIDEIINCLLK